MAVTIKDVAERAGVSVGTVSMALNNNEKVNHETSKKIHEIASELNYIPNTVAKALTKKKTGVVALVIPTVDNHFYSEMIQAIKNVLKKCDYNLILCTMNWNTEEEIRYLNMFKSGVVDGVIFACYNGNNENIIEFAKNYKPVVYIDKAIDNNNLIPHVKADLKKAAYKATNYLIELGHTDVGYILHEEERIQGFKEAMEDNGCAMNEEFLYSNRNMFFDRVKNNKKLPSAIVCFNDYVAFRVMLFLSRAGLKVPEDISICGIDNVSMAKMYDPPLTTVDVPIDKIALRGVKLLIELINGEKLKAEDYLIEYNPDLIIRESSCEFRSS
ncbi:LacI family DNA-binding transcriptional regulator [Natronospora cellulosivora (SeqCode)]